MGKGYPEREEFGGGRDRENPKGKSLVEKMGRNNSQEGIITPEEMRRCLSWNRI